MSTSLPRLTQASAPLTERVLAVDEHGQSIEVSIPAERALTLYVDKRELVTLMTLGAHPEWLVLGYLRNQRLIGAPHEVESITVDWEVGAAAVATRRGIERIEQRTAQRVVTTGCGQGSVFGDLMADLDSIRLGDARLTQAQLYGLLNAIRLQESTYKSAGSVHGCALFAGERMLTFIEDVGRHNAIDTIAGWMWLQNEAPTLPASRGALPPEEAAPALGRPGGGVVGLRGGDKVFYTTGRLTSEMVIKSAQMGVPIVVSRSGITQMGLQVAQRLGLCAIGRAVNRRFVCYSAPERLRWAPELAAHSLPKE